MRRTTVVFVMLIAMLWQSLTMASVGSTINALADQAHAALHLQGQGHHHHDDGSYHVDDSNESAQHVFSDHVGAPAALLLASSQAFAPSAMAALEGRHETRVPSPTLDGPFRPPRSGD